jgi:hypothetical protein
MQVSDGQAAEVALGRGFFGERERVVLRYAGLQAALFRYDTGVEAIRLSNARGHVLVLPYLGQMVWDATFDGVRLGMDSMFEAPRPATIIVQTYGCLAYHAGLLRNGVPSTGDDHVLHGEIACAVMTGAGLACGTDRHGPWMAVTGEYEHAMGFGPHYRATPRVVLRPDSTEFEVEMAVENLAAKPMDLMYICHANFGFVEGGRIVQPVAFTPDNVVTRTAIPGHVVPNDDYRAFIAELADNPARMQVLDEPARYDPEQVFYIKNLHPQADGLVRFALARPGGDAFTIAWDPVAMPHTIRWILENGDQRVAAFAMPGTCEPEGYSAERRKGNVRALAPGASAKFTTTLGYADKQRTPALLRSIEG